MSGNDDDQNDPFSADLSLITQDTPPNRVFSILCNNIIAFLAQASYTTIPMVVNRSIFDFIGNLSQSFNSANNDQKSRLIIVARIIHEYVNNFDYRYQHLTITNFAIAIGDNSIDFSIEFSEYDYIVEISINFTDSPNPTG